MSSIPIFIILLISFTTSAKADDDDNYCPPDGSHVPETLCIEEPVCAIIFDIINCRHFFQVIPDNSDIAHFNDSTYYSPEGSAFLGYEGWKYSGKYAVLNKIHSIPCGETNTWKYVGWGKMIDSAVVRKGCTLQLYEKKDYQGRNKAYDYRADTNVRDFREDLASEEGVQSLKCHCT